jgi:hypothetical protein
MVYNDLPDASPAAYFAAALFTVAGGVFFGAVSYHDHIAQAMSGDPLNSAIAGGGIFMVPLVLLSTLIVECLANRRIPWLASLGFLAVGLSPATLVSAHWFTTSLETNMSYDIAVISALALFVVAILSFSAAAQGMGRLVAALHGSRTA